MGSEGKKEQRNVWHIDDFSDDVPEKTYDCPPCKKKFRNKFQGHNQIEKCWLKLLLEKLEGNVLLEPAAAMNQMLVLKCFINVYSSMLPGIISLCTFSALHTTHSLCTLTSVS